MGVESVILRFDVDRPSVAEILSSGAAFAFRCWHWILGLGMLSFLWHVVHGRRRELASNLLFPALWATGLLSYIVQVKGLPYTLGAVFAATVPILCSGLGLSSERISSAQGWRKLLVIGIVMLTLGGTVKKWAGTFGSSVEYLTGQVAAEEHYGKYIADDGMTTWEAISLARELGELVPEDGTIFVWGRANVINFLSKRPQPTRFHHNVILVRPGFQNIWRVDGISGFGRIWRRRSPRSASSTLKSWRIRVSLGRSRSSSSAIFWSRTIDLVDKSERAESI